MAALVTNMINAYRVGIDSLEWMSPETKAQAKEKLAHFKVKIGAPDKWRDYSALTIKRDDLFGNVMRCREFEYADMVGRLGKPVDHVALGHDAADGERVLQLRRATRSSSPPAILQPPFFDPNADDAVNYGAIGAVIGHEIGHGFDDQGRKSDGDGESARLVDGGGREVVPGAHHEARRPVRRDRPDRQACTSTAS